MRCLQNRRSDDSAKNSIFKAHGSSGADAIANGIDKLALFIEKDTITELAKMLAQGGDVADE
mgnify:CR=1 FL=1